MIIYVFFTVPPTIEKISIHNSNPVVNQTVRIECDAQGLPFPKITWYKDGSIISSNTGRFIHSGGGRYLDIQNVLTSDSGWYECFAENIAGLARKEQRLSVNGNRNYYVITHLMYVSLIV